MTRVSERHNFGKWLYDCSTAICLCVAVLFVVSGCGSRGPKPHVEDPKLVPSQVSYNLNSTESKDGNRTYRLVTPLMEHYGLVGQPYTEFTRGLKVETYNDSTLTISSDLRADYAHYVEDLKLWEVRGNVVANNYHGNRRLYCEQLWWDERTGMIYSNSEVRVVEGRSVHVGIGFESDSEFTRWSFRRPRGQMYVEQSDSTGGVATPDTVVRRPVGTGVYAAGSQLVAQ